VNPGWLLPVDGCAGAFADWAESPWAQSRQIVANTGQKLAILSLDFISLLRSKWVIRAALSLNDHRCAMQTESSLEHFENTG
jgi:hypothetical protein